MNYSETSPENLLGNAPIVELLRKFAIPSILSLLVGAAYNITDQVFIGRIVGMLGNAATNVVFPTVTMTIAFSQLLGVGTSANFNMNMGAKREDKAKRFISNGLTLIPLTGFLIMSIVLIFKTPILILCGATKNIMPYASAYIGITAFGIPFLLFSSAGSMIIRADGSPTYSMTCTTIGAVLNIFLDWVFMFIFPWGIQGAASATLISQIVSALLCLLYFFRFKAFKISLNMLGLQTRYTVMIAKLGLSNFINHTNLMLVRIVTNNTLRFYGAVSIYGSDIPLAVSGVSGKLVYILSSISIGLAHGCQPIWSFNMGAKNYKRVKKAYKNALKLALAVNFISFLLFQTFPREIISIFGAGEELYFQFAERYMRIFMMMVIVSGVQPLSINYFTSIGNTKQGIIHSLSRHDFFMIPLMLLFPIRFGIDGALYAGPIADSLACILALTMVTLNFRKLDKLPKA